MLYEDDVINAIEDYGVIDGYNDTLQIIDIIKQLPPAQPVHNTGKLVRGICARFALGFNDNNVSETIISHRKR